MNPPFVPGSDPEITLMAKWLLRLASIPDPPAPPPEPPKPMRRPRRKKQPPDKKGDS